MIQQYTSIVDLVDGAKKMATHKYSQYAVKRNNVEMESRCRLRVWSVDCTRTSLF